MLKKTSVEDIAVPSQRGPASQSDGNVDYIEDTDENNDAYEDFSTLIVCARRHCCQGFTHAEPKPGVLALCVGLFDRHAMFENSWYAKQRCLRTDTPPPDLD
jgi:hypothetical protein